MFFVSFALFVLGIACFGFAWEVPGLQALIFILGILLVSAALALPIHFGGWARRPGH